MEDPFANSRSYHPFPYRHSRNQINFFRIPKAFLGHSTKMQILQKLKFFGISFFLTSKTYFT